MKTYSKAPEFSLDLKKKYTALFSLEIGDFEVELYAEKVPTTVNNFVFLARDGYYNGTTFHRVIPGFMAQGGDPTGTGMGGPGYKFADEFHPSLKHDKPGILSMANAGANTNGSQFFITHIATDWLQDKHTIFGEVKGPDDQKVVNSIKQGDVIKAIVVL